MKGQAESAEHHRQAELAEAQETAKRMSELTVNLTAKAGSNGKLFGSITSKDVAEALTMQHHIKLDKKNSLCPTALKRSA